MITVVKNDIKNITNTIKSIQSQNFENFEYLIIDGKSSDVTFEKIKKYRKFIDLIKSEKDKRYLFCNEQRRKKLARGKVIVFVNSGDTLTKKCFKKSTSKILQK